MTLLKKFDTLQRDVKQLKQPKETDTDTSVRSQSGSRDIEREDSSKSWSRLKRRERGYSQSHSCSPVSIRHRSWADRMDKNDNEVPDYEKDVHAV